MNDAGLALATLDVYASRDGSKMFDMNGAPLALTYRQILEECTTVEEAQALLEKTPRTTWMNLACCDKNKAVIFELTPKVVGVRNPEGDILRCTNHFVLPDLGVGIRCERFKTFGQLIDFKAGEKFTLEEVHRCMHAVHQNELTFQTMVFEPKAMKLHVAFGPGPCTQKPLQVIELAERAGVSPARPGRAATLAPGRAAVSELRRRRSGLRGRLGRRPLPLPTCTTVRPTICPARIVCTASWTLSSGVFVASDSGRPASTPSRGGATSRPALHRGTRRSRCRRAGRRGE